MTSDSDNGTAELQLNLLEAVHDALDVALGLEDSVFLLGEDIADPVGGVWNVTRGLSTKFGTDRVRNTPISEQAIIGAAIGSAIAGMRPVAEIMLMNFVAVCMDQLSNHAAKLRYMSGGQTTVPLTVRTASGAGGQFGAQHSEMLEAWLVHVPGLNVVVPSTPADAKGLLLSCIFNDDPCVFVEQHHLYYGPQEPVPAGDARVPLGRARIVREGSAATVIAYGAQTHEAVVAADALAADGVDVEILDLRTLVPLDRDAVLGSVAKTKRAVVVHEAVRRAGFGGELAALISEELFSSLEAPVARVAGKDTPVPYATELETAFMPQATDIEAAVRALVG